MAARPSRPTSRPTCAHRSTPRSPRRGLVGYAAELRIAASCRRPVGVGARSTFKLAPSASKAPREALSQRKWREGRSIEALAGSVVLDAETGAPLAIDVDAKIAVLARRPQLRDEGEALRSGRESRQGRRDRRAARGRGRRDAGPPPRGRRPRLLAAGHRAADPQEPRRHGRAAGTRTRRPCTRPNKRLGERHRAPRSPMRRDYLVPQRRTIIARATRGQPRRCDSAALPRRPGPSAPCSAAASSGVARIAPRRSRRRRDQEPRVRHVEAARARGPRRRRRRDAHRRPRGEADDARARHDQSRALGRERTSSS